MLSIDLMNAASVEAEIRIHGAIQRSRNDKIAIELMVTAEVIEILIKAALEAKMVIVKESEGRYILSPSAAGLEGEFGRELASAPQIEPGDLPPCQEPTSSSALEPAPPSPGSVAPAPVRVGSCGCSSSGPIQVPGLGNGDSSQKLVFFVASEYIGDGDPKLGHVLIRSAIKVIKDIVPKPSTVVFMNSGVKLAVKDSFILADVLALVDAGIEVLSCGTCLDFYNIKDQLSAGRISNMVEILSRLSGASRVIRL